MDSYMAPGWGFVVKDILSVNWVHRHAELPRNVMALIKDTALIPTHPSSLSHPSPLPPLVRFLSLCLSILHLLCLLILPILPPDLSHFVSFPQVATVKSCAS